MKKVFFLCFVGIVLFGTSLFAQGAEKDVSKGKVGLTFPTTGIIWHITDSIAILPNAGFQYNWSSQASSPLTNSGTSLGVGASLRFYLTDWKGIRLYLSPKYSFSRASSTADLSSPAGSTTTSTLHGHTVTGAWGLQYPITNRVTIFGDIGAAYNRSTSSSDSPAVINRVSYGNAIQSTGSFGLILYLK